MKITFASKRSRIFLVAASCFMAGCKKNPPPVEKRQFPPEVLAFVNDQTITTTEFKNRLQQFPAQQRNYLSSPDGRKQFLNQLIHMKIMLILSQREGFQNDPAIKQKIEEYRESSSDASNPEERVEQYRQILLMQAYFKGVHEHHPVTPERIQAFYNAHADRFRRRGSDEPQPLSAVQDQVARMVESQDLNMELDRQMTSMDIQINDAALNSLSLPGSGHHSNP